MTDTYHSTIEQAKRQAAFEFNVEDSDWEEKGREQDARSGERPAHGSTYRCRLDTGAITGWEFSGCPGRIQQLQNRRLERAGSDLSEFVALRCFEWVVD